MKEEAKDTLFFNSKVKIERTKLFIKELGDELAQYFNTKPYRVVVEEDPESGNHNWTLREKNEVPDNLSHIIGQAAHTLCASLDALAAELVSMAGAKVKNVYFPFAEDAKSSEKMLELSGIDRAGDEVVEIVRSLKPYKGGNELLTALHNLDTFDNGRAHTATVHYVGIKNLQKLRSNDPLLEVDKAHCGPIHDGTVIVSLPPSSKYRPGKSFQPALKITFDEEPMTRDKNIVEALGGLTALTEEVIGIFATHLGAAGEQGS